MPRGGERGGEWGDQKERAGIKTGEDKARGWGGAGSVKVYVTPVLSRSSGSMSRLVLLT